MAVLLFEKRFWKPIFSGDKLHSIRPTRKRAINPGDPLSLRGWEGVAYRSKQVILSDEVCINVMPIRIDLDGIYIDNYGRIREPDELDEFAKTDGFANWQEMRGYRNMFYNLPFSGDFIQWGLNKFLETKRS